MEKKPIKIYPRCHPYDYTKPKPPKSEWIRPKPPTYSTRGWFVPCCWCDMPDMKEFEQFGILDEELKVENVKNLKQVFLSKQWIKFHKMLTEDQENAPSCCKERCSVKNTWRKKM